MLSALPTKDDENVKAAVAASKAAREAEPSARPVDDLAKKEELLNAMLAKA